MIQFLEMKVYSLFLEGEWVIPSEMPNVIEIEDFQVLDEERYKRVWNGAISGEFSLASAVESIRDKFPALHWTKKVWNNSIHPSISSNVWKLDGNVCATVNNMKNKNLTLPQDVCFVNMRKSFKITSYDIVTSVK